MVFNNPNITSSFHNSVLIVVLGTLINVTMTILASYAFSRKNVYITKKIMPFVIFTMYFSGGMIPSYLLIKKLHLYNTFWVMIIPGAVSAWNLIIMRTFFQSNVPMELQEAAIIDGCNDIAIFFRIALPLSAPIVAVMVLFYGVGHWNEFFNALIYLDDRKKYPLQLFLREILIQNISQDNVSGPAADQQIIGQSIRYSLIIVATVPVLMIYPFLQKYFVKGIMIGSLKG